MADTTTAAEWPTTPLTIADLRRAAFASRDMTSSFEWLKTIGIVPEDIVRMDIRQVLTDLDPEAVPVKYLAASAFEFDSWGENSPVDFIKAIAAEARGAKRDLITMTLESLGRQMVAA